MTASIVKILGYLPDKSRFTAPGKRFQADEVVRVKVSDPRGSAVHLVSLLPVYGAPGSLSINPDQVTFTFYQSRHPSNSFLYLDDIGSIQPVEGMNLFYDIPLIYRQPPITEPGTQNAPKEERRDQKMLKPEVDDPDENTPIVSPLLRPPIYSRNARIVERDSFRKPDGSVIKQRNGLPIRQPIKVPVVEIVHSWTWNMTWPPNMSTLKNLEGKTNADTLTLGTPLTIAVGKAKVEPFTFSEEYETPANSTTVYHYARITMTLVECELGWDLKIPSMSTLQRKAIGSTQMVPIIINDRGDVAKEPWPLDEDGLALTKEEVAAGDMSRIAFLDDGYPESTNVDPFMDTNSLRIKAS